MVIIRGGLQVDGSSTIINSSKVDISDHTILLASNAPNQEATNGAGIEISGNKYFKYKFPDNKWESNIDISANISGNASTASNVAYSGLTGSITTWNQNTTGSAATLTTSRNIGGVSFNGSADINLSGVNTVGNQNTTGNAATATALQNARTIANVSFDGSSDIDLPGVNTVGNQNTTGTATNATNLTGGGHNVYVINAGVPELNCVTGSMYAGYPNNNIHVFYAVFSGSFFPSDDRIKWNETLLTSDRSTNIIKDIKFYQYDILKRPLRDSYDTYDPIKSRKGFGVIAQEVEALKVKYPELSDVVENTTANGDIKAVNYNNLFSIMGATIQSLIKRIETLEAEVKVLKSK